jgi:DNA primase
LDANMWVETHFDIRAGRGNWISANCPFCSEHGKSPDTKFHLGISIERNMAHCFRCHYKKSLAGLVMEIERCSFAEAYEIIGGHMPSRDNLNLREIKINKRVSEIELPEECHQLSRTNARHRRAIDYLKNRGIDFRTAQFLSYGFAVTGEYAQRIIIPVLFGTKVVGFTARTILPKADEPLRYKTAQDFKSAKYLYNYDHAKESEFVVIMEGPLDVARLPQYAVGLFTNQMSDAQVLLVTKTWKRAVIMLDRDAYDSAWEIQKRLSGFMDCTVAALPNSKDPGCAPVPEIAGALAKAHGGLWI